MRVILLALIAVILVGCKNYSSTSWAAQAKTDLIGKKRTDILACMGAPNARDSIDNLEVWSYMSGGRSSMFATGGGSTFGNTSTGSFFGTSASHYCKVDIVFSDKIVQKINYSGRTNDGLLQDAECGYVFENCVGGN